MISDTFWKFKRNYIVWLTVESWAFHNGSHTLGWVRQHTVYMRRVVVASTIVEELEASSEWHFVKHVMVCHVTIAQTE